jgi:hypothetical protein
MVSAGNADSFVAAMKDFGETQTMRATAHPELLNPWNWGRMVQPNLLPLESWAVARLQTCEKQIYSKNEARIDLRSANLTSAVLIDSDLSYADLRDAILWEATLSGTNLRNADLRNAVRSGDDLSSSDLRDADLRGAILGGGQRLLQTIFTARTNVGIGKTHRWIGPARILLHPFDAVNLHGAALDGAKYDKQTLFPDGFNPVDRGMVRVD